MSSSPLSITAEDAAGNVLCLTFDWRRDRWQHVIVWSPPSASQPVRFCSREGGEADHWPPSPPLQEVVVEPREPRRGGTAMLLGRAGSSHWSAAMELNPEPLQLVIDVACRIGQPPEAIGSNYALECPPDIEATLAPSDLILRASDCLRVSAGSGELRTASTQGAGIFFAPVLAPAPATLRWTYQFLVTRDDRARK